MKNTEIIIKIENLINEGKLVESLELICKLEEKIYGETSSYDLYFNGKDIKSWIEEKELELDQEVEEHDYEKVLKLEEIKDDMLYQIYDDTKWCNIISIYNCIEYCGDIVSIYRCTADELVKIVESIKKDVK